MTKELFDPLDNNELERLDRLLFDRVNEDDVTEGDDEGVLNVSELDGLFTAIVSGPVMIPPSQCLPVVWGDFEPVWESDEEMQDILSLMMRHMNGIAAMLMEQPQDFEPIFHQRGAECKNYIIVDEWCEGYIRGVALAADVWEAAGLVMKILLAPISSFTSVSSWHAHDFTSEIEVENIREAITPTVREIHAFWLARRQRENPSAAPVRRSEPRVGRNDPCPCGSGKKV